MRPPVFHLRDPRIRYRADAGPFGVRRLLLAGSVEPRQLGPRRRRNAWTPRPAASGTSCSPRPSRGVILLRNAAFAYQRRRVDAPASRPVPGRVTKVLQHPGEHRLGGLDAQQLPRPRDRRVVGRRRRRRQTQERPQTQRIGLTPRNRPQTIGVGLRNTRPAAAGNTGPEPGLVAHPRIERGAQLLNEGIEARRAQYLVQPLVEGMPAALGQVRASPPTSLVGTRRRGSCMTPMGLSLVQRIGGCRSRQNRLSPRAPKRPHVGLTASQAPRQWQGTPRPPVKGWGWGSWTARTLAKVNIPQHRKNPTNIPSGGRVRLATGATRRAPKPVLERRRLSKES